VQIKNSFIRIKLIRLSNHKYVVKPHHGHPLDVSKEFTSPWEHFYTSSSLIFSSSSASLDVRSYQLY